MEESRLRLNLPVIRGETKGEGTSIRDQFVLLMMHPGAALRDMAGSTSRRRAMVRGQMQGQAMGESTVPTTRLRGITRMWTRMGSLNAQRVLLRV